MERDRGWHHQQLLGAALTATGQVPPRRRQAHGAWRGACVLSIAAGVMRVALASQGLDVAVDSGHYLARERLDGGTLVNEERGELVGGKVGIWWSQGAMRLGLSLGHLEGTLRYVGRSQIGFPVRTHTRIDIDTMALHGRWTLAEDGPLSVHLMAAVGERRIDRRIAASLRSTPLSEVMRWRFIQLGAQARRDLGSGWFIGGRLHLETGTDARLAIDFHGLADPAVVRPRNASGHHVALELGRHVRPNTTVLLQIGTSRQRYGSSDWQPYSRNGQPAGLIRYPGSTQRLDQVRLAIDIAWN